MSLEGSCTAAGLLLTCVSLDLYEQCVCLQMALERGIAPDDEAIRQLIQERNSPLAGMSVEAIRWPEEPLRSAMIRMPKCSSAGRTC